MTVLKEWHQLRLKLIQREFSLENFRNSFYQRLMTVLHDPSTSVADRISAYSDALLSAPEGEDVSLPLVDFLRTDAALLEEGGLRADNTWQHVSLSDSTELQSDEGVVSLKEVYSLTKRRNIETYPIDPSLSRLLHDENYKSYNGYAQQMAVRLALTAKDDATLIINLPTGSGLSLIHI